MSVKNDKEKIIDEIMDLRTMIGELATSENEDAVAEAQTQLNKIQDKVFSI